MAWIGPKGRWAARWHFWVTGTILIVACGAAWAWIRHASILHQADSAIHEQSVQEAAASGSHDHEAEGENENPPGHDHPTQSAEPDEHNPLDNAGEGHNHSESEAIKLGVQAQKNIGVRLQKVSLSSFERTITVPGMIVERPGWSSVEITAPMTGIIAKIFPIQGEAVISGQPLFEVRLTHEDLLEKQTAFLRTIEEIEVVKKEVARLQKVSADGAIAGKTLLERQYELQKQEAACRAQRQALVLHGLSEEQIKSIENAKTLLKSLTLTAPWKEPEEMDELIPHNYQVQELKVSQGSYVTAGSQLCRLTDYAELYIEGKAFEQDVRAIQQASAQGLRVSASFGAVMDAGSETLSGLRILYLDDQVNPDTRAFPFYVSLVNRIAREEIGENGRRFLYWKYKPGQRVQLKIPVEKWENRIVLPADAVAQDGADYYVFEANGDHFDRRAVHVEYRDADWVVIADNGAIKPGVMVATSAAHQMQLALKNKSGSAVDPHAGHNH